MTKADADLAHAILISAKYPAFFAAIKTINEMQKDFNLTWSALLENNPELKQLLLSEPIDKTKLQIDGKIQISIIKPNNEIEAFSNKFIKTPLFHIDFDVEPDLEHLSTTHSNITITIRFLPHPSFK